MGEFFRYIFGLFVIGYVSLCSLAVPVKWFTEVAEERACAEQHHVYECIKVEEWKPMEARHD